MDRETREKLEFPVILPHEKTKADPLSPAMKERIEQLYTEGQDYTQIGRELNINYQMVSYHCKKNRIPLAARLLQRHIVTIVQECEQKLIKISGTSKTIQINAPIQLVGDKAIEAALSGKKPITSNNGNRFIHYGLNDELSLKKAKRDLEMDLIKKALHRTNGNHTHACKLLEISHRCLLYKMKEYGIQDGEITFGE